MPATAVVIACQTLARDCGTQSFTPPTSSGPSCNRQLVNAGGAGQSADLPAPGRASALACSGDDVAHLVGVKGQHGDEVVFSQVQTNSRTRPPACSTNSRKPLPRCTLPRKSLVPWSVQLPSPT